MPLFHNTQTGEVIRAVPGRPEAARLDQAPEWVPISEAQLADLRAGKPLAAALAEATPAGKPPKPAGR